MVQSMVPVVVTSLMVWGEYSPYGYLGPFGVESPRTRDFKYGSLGPLKGPN